MIRRIAWYSIAPLISLLAFYRVFRTWFVNDDFGWLTLPEWLSDTGLMWTLFHPVAQGTIRVLSERIPFLVFPSLFGMNPLPFRILAFVTWIAALTLAALIGKKLTGSTAAGLTAAILWSVNAAMTRPLGWASDYNEILCITCILLAFYARLRGLKVQEWIAYLVGFAVLEVIVVYPAIALLHALCFDRKKWRSTLPLFIPSAIFIALHLWVIPRTPTTEYQIALDGRILSTLAEYLKWSAGPTRLYEFTGSWLTSGKIAAAAMGAIAGAFVAWRTWRRDFLPLFCCGWFLLLLSPMLILPNHVMDYALATALPGLMWLAAYCVLRWRAAGGLLAAVYFVTMFYETSLYTEWYRARSARMRAVFEGVRTAQRLHPKTIFLLQGIDPDIFQSGFADNPWELLSATVYLVPGQGNEPEDMKRVTIPVRRVLDMIDHRQAVVLGFAGNSMRDVTPIYRTVVRREDLVDVADSRSASQLGPGWYPAEDRLRWMGKSATLKLWGPDSPSQKLHITGYAPKAVVPVTLRFTIGSHDIGMRDVKSPDRPFSFEFALPASLVGQPEIELKIEASRTYRPPGDARDLGMGFGTFAIR